MKLLIQQLQTNNPFCHYFLSQIVSEFLLKPHETNSWNQIAEVLTQYENSLIITQAAASEETSKVIAGATILKSIFSCRECAYLLRENLIVEDDVLQEVEEDNVSEIVKMVIASIGKFEKRLLRSSEVFVGTCTREIPMFGNDRMTILELLFACLRLNFKSLNEEIGKSNLIKIVVDCFFQFEMNSILHGGVEKIINAIFVSGPEEDCLVESLIDSGIIGRICSDAGGKGYSGYVIKIANFFIKIREKSEKLNAAIEKCEGWGDFCKNYLEKQNETESSSLGDSKKSDFRTEIDDFADTKNKISQFLSKISGHHSNSRNIIAVHQSSFEEKPLDLISKEPETEENFNFEVPEDMQIDSETISEEKPEKILSQEDSSIKAEPELVLAEYWNFTEKVPEPLSFDAPAYWRFGFINT